MDCVKSITLVFMVSLFPITVFAQFDASHQIEIGIPEVALINIASNGNGDMNFSPFSGNEAGSTFVMNKGNKNKSTWLNYSSIKKGNSHSRKVMAALQGELTDGIYLKVTPKIMQNTGGGDVGEADMTVVLTNRPTEVITGIGSCYTGKGVNKGFNLVYELEIDESELDFARLNKTNLTFNVLYTLTD
jgi:hypothetical protein